MGDENNGVLKKKDESNMVEKSEEKNDDSIGVGSDNYVGWFWTSFKLAVALTLLALAVSDLGTPADTEELSDPSRRRLEEAATSGETPSYMEPLLNDLKERKKLMEETPPEEVKYWFEYTGPLQRYYYRYSKSRGKADSFEGRDDSGVVSARFVEKPGGGKFFEKLPHEQLLKNCRDMGHGKENCRVLVTLNMVGAGRGATMLWETSPPRDVHPKPWISEQETAATHLERNLRELNHMCASDQMIVQVQVLVCEPIPGQWTDWMDSMLPACGGQPLSETIDPDQVNVEERPSPVQVVVVASAQSADTCHDLKSGFMEKRMQDLILAPPYLNSDKPPSDPTIKTTHPDLISSDDHDLYIALKWSSLVTTRSVSGFLQASVDLAHAASTPADQEEDGTTVALNGPSSPFLIPSFVRVSYVSEENNKVAKWRMHGDFFHPAAWEISKDSYDMTWIPDKTLPEKGQWWLYMAEEQMPTNPEIYANQVSPPIVQGGSNFIWMITEKQRRALVQLHSCRQMNKAETEKKDCGELPQAVIPLGDFQSFLINFTPNTALGKKHVKDHRPGYSRAEEMELDRELVRERKQLKGQEDIEKALFDYTVYASALMHKDATLKAARARDAVITKNPNKEIIGPQTVKSSYYDVTITKPREPTLAWCQHMARHGLCSLYSQYFRTSKDTRCHEACGLKKNWTPIPPTSK